MIVLGIETSCDETAVAIVRKTPPPDDSVGGEILANCVFSQADTHAPYGGVVPELAARAHMQRLDNLLHAALEKAEMRLDALDAIAATAGPGLVGGLLVGLTFGKALALASGKRFIAINHLEGHALTVRLTHGTPFPYLLLLVSGGHCQLLEISGFRQYTLLGSTRDDAVGEAFDKAAKLLRLTYPGGPEIEKRATHGNPNAFDFPRPLSGDASCDFSFSGLKTALRRAAEAAQPIPPQMPPQIVDDLAAGFQAAVLDCLADRSARAMQVFEKNHPQNLHFVVAGGVAANLALRTRLQNLAQTNGFAMTVAPPALCTDNAAMIAWAALEQLAANIHTHEGLNFSARARWPLAEI